MTTAAESPRKADKSVPIGARTISRHLLVIVIAAVSVYVFAMVHGQWSPMHRWNRAFGDAAVLLLGATMTLGALPRLYRPSASLLPWRRELGIYAVVLATVHTVIILQGWVEWDLFRLFGFEFHPLDMRYVMLQQGFGFANAVGVLALGIGLVLLLTSSDRAVRLLGPNSWKTLQMTALVFWALVVAHTGYFLYAHFLSFHRPIPAPNPLQIPFAAMVVAVFALRTTAFFITMRRRSSKR
jgi:methionine sulfoxide reductase heme-binding subunit